MDYASHIETVIIIGAGPAGLTAGYELLKSGLPYKIIIIDEGNAVGGIARTINYKGNRMDIGGHRFFSKNDKVMQWWQNIMPIQGTPAYDDLLLHHNKHYFVDGPDPEICDNTLLLRDRISRIYYSGKFYEYPVSLKLDTIMNLGLQTTVMAISSYLKSCLFKSTENNLEDFYINRFGRSLYKIFFESYTEKLWGRHPRTISADWGAQRVKGLSIKAIITDAIVRGLIHSNNRKVVETSLITRFLYPKYGPGQLWEKVSEEIKTMGGQIYNNSRVTKINIQNDKINSISYLNKGVNKTISGDIYISSMPLKDLVNALDDTVITTDIHNIANGLPYRDFVTIGLLVNKLLIENETHITTINSIIPDNWIYVQDPGIKLGRIQIFNNWSPYMVKDINNTVWLGLEYFCTEGDGFWNMTEQECAQFAADELVRIGIINKSDILDYHRERVKKAYPAYFDTYDKMTVLIDSLNNFKNLYCIGRNGQHRYNNMDHSMITAFEAVNCIVNNLEDKSSIWNVNTEKKYHEG